MKKRTLFFWLERLKINPAERKALILVMALFTALAMTNAVLKPKIPFDQAYYEDLERVFKQRTALLRQREEKIRVRYQPEAQQPVPVRPDTIPGDTAKVNDAQESSGKAKKEININTASASMLETLPGIGPVYARRIIEYRKKNGPFSSYEELLPIKGIGKKRLGKLKPFIKLKGSTENQ